GEPTAEAQITLTRKALVADHILEGEDSAVAHFHAARVAGAEGEPFETLRRTVAHAVVVEGDKQLKALATHDPDANRRAHLAAA
ncbi:hypothetical protein NL467_26505, partial [Klebsiella pneumoniae]|nr:hypothetical protein [Klebsiella pneumoniae]